MRSKRHVATPKTGLPHVDLARPFLVSPAIKIELKTASKWLCPKRKAVARGNPIFGSVEPCHLLETRSSLNYARKSKLFFFLSCTIRSMAQTLCYDLARAEKAKDGKKKVNQSWILFKLQAFNTTGEDHFLESKKPMCLRP